MKVVFLLPVPSQPRFHRRIAGLQAQGVEAKALYFSRSDYFRGGTLPCESRRIGEVQHRSYLTRMMKLISGARIARREIDSADAVYAFGLDMALLGRVCLRRGDQQLIYELGDVHAMQLNPGIKGSAVRTLERWVLSRVSEVIVTAKGFATGYFNRFHSEMEATVSVIENRPPLPANQRPLPRIYNGRGPIVIGYFGLLRCPRSWSVLKRLATSSEGRIVVSVRGRPLGLPVAEDAEKTPSIHFGGEYTAPDDLAELYGAVDVVWGCNTTALGSDLSTKWGRTNRFFESCFFRRPLIALRGGDEGKEVEALGNGIAVALDDPEQVAGELLEIIPREIDRWQRAALEVPDELCIPGHDLEALANRLGQRQAT